MYSVVEISPPICHYKEGNGIYPICFVFIYFSLDIYCYAFSSVFLFVSIALFLGAALFSPLINPAFPYFPFPISDAPSPNIPIFFPPLCYLSKRMILTRFLEIRSIVLFIYLNCDMIGGYRSYFCAEFLLFWYDWRFFNLYRPDVRQSLRFVWNSFSHIDRVSDISKLYLDIPP